MSYTSQLVERYGDALAVEAALAAEMHLTVQEAREVAGEAFEMAISVAGWGGFRPDDHRLIAAVFTVQDTREEMEQYFSFVEEYEEESAVWPLPQADADAPTAWEKMGEMGADW